MDGHFDLNIIVGIFAIIATILVELVPKPKKSLCYKILSTERIKDQDNINTSTESIEEITSLRIEIKNNGNIPITAQEIENGIYINLPSNSKIINAEIENKKPSLMKIDIVNLAITKLKLLIDFMNADDNFILKLLIGNFSNKITVDSRIVGIKSIRRKKRIFVGLFKKFPLHISNKKKFIENMVIIILFISLFLFIFLQFSITIRIILVVLVTSILRSIFIQSGRDEIAILMRLLSIIIIIFILRKQIMPVITLIINFIDTSLSALVAVIP